MAAIRRHWLAMVLSSAVVLVGLGWLALAYLTGPAVAQEGGGYPAEWATMDEAALTQQALAAC